jgi:hypothetical protein
MPPSPLEPVDPLELTEDQRRHLGVFLNQIEAAVVEVMSLSERGLQDRILQVDVADLPAGFGVRVQPEVDRIRRAIETLVARFGLEPDRRSRLRRAQALLVTAIVVIEDTRSRAALKGFGPVDAAVQRGLDPVLDEISRALRAMTATLLAADAPDGQPSNAGGAA